VRTLGLASFDATPADFDAKEVGACDAGGKPLRWRGATRIRAPASPSALRSVSDVL
jgi:hypothetical protein